MKIKLFDTKKSNIFSRVILSVLLAIIILVAFLYGFSTVPDSTHKEQQKMTQQNVRNALVTCYAIEGIYPKDIQYLKDHYGLYVDDRFEVFYSAELGNIFPTVNVVEKGMGDHVVEE